MKDTTFRWVLFVFLFLVFVLLAQFIDDFHLMVMLLENAS